MKYIKHTAEMDNVTLDPVPTGIRKNFLVKVSVLRHLPPTYYTCPVELLISVLKKILAGEFGSSLCNVQWHITRETVNMLSILTV